MPDQSINIKFPFTDSVKGFFLDTNKTTKDALVSDILHVILTKRGQRFYDPNFGSDLYQYLFEPNDALTISDVKDSINNSLQQAMPNIQITNITVTPTENTINVVFSAVDSEDVFQEQLIFEVNF